MARQSSLSIELTGLGQDLAIRDNATDQIRKSLRSGDEPATVITQVDYERSHVLCTEFRERGIELIVGRGDKGTKVQISNLRAGDAEDRCRHYGIDRH